MANPNGGFIVLNPTPDRFPVGGDLSPRLDILRGKTVAFLDNNKLQPLNKYFQRLGEMLIEREGVKKVRHHHKPFFTRPARQDILDPVAEHADAAVTGLGE
jgi:hypothetical protein